MENVESAGAQDPISANMYAVGKKAGTGELIDLPDLPQDTLDEIGRLMNALARLREAELVLSEASRKYMKLSAQDMRALHYLIAAKRQGEIVTPGMISSHLRISAASTTKLLNRLERDGHVIRRLHPTDRRAFAIEITPETEASAKRTVGRHQARRFYAAARLTSSEREVVTRFLDDMTAEISLDKTDWPQDADTHP